MPSLGHQAVLLIAGLALLPACSSGPGREATSNVADRAARYATAMVGAPYRYGGTTPRGFDCSGLVHYSYRRAGASVPRSTELLWKYSDSIALRSLRPGDLLFFDQEGKRSSHVAVYIGDDRFVHAPSSGKHVRISELNNPYWQRHLAGARRPNVY